MQHEKIANNSGAQLTADSGYQGITKLHTNSVLPKKSSKKSTLIEARLNAEPKYSRKRIAVEHVIALVNRFRTLS